MAGASDGSPSQVAGAPSPHRLLTFVRTAGAPSMCGISGFVDFTRTTGREALIATASRMSATLAHRGPDDGGVWVDENAGVALAHRRLSILDLTPEGRQPMSSPDGRYVVSFNGEIYNHESLRRQLAAAGHRFRGHSDTEVLVTAIQEWGIDAAVERFNGMFAAALWDRAERILYLFRDRFGEKPLYYGTAGTHVLFGSELKALRAHPAFERNISRSALALYMRHNHVPAPHCIYDGVAKLLPGSVLSVRVESRRVGQPRRYWSVEAAYASGLRNRFAGSDAEAVDRLDELLRDSVALRMQADVPLGAFLSGGIDSSTVVALMQAQTTQRVRTFAIGFTEPEYDEAPAARAVARHLGTEHTELYVSPQDARAVIPSLPRIYDEPFADSSQIPTWLVSRLARTRLTVSLSGDGGDEIFAGYERYRLTRRLWNAVRWLPRPSRVLLARALAGLTAPVPPRVLKRLHRLSAVLPAPDAETFYQEMVFSHWQVPRRGLVAVDETDPPLADARRGRGSRGTLLDRMMLWDLKAYLPDDILVKVDRASMNVSLEARIPLLDHRLAEFAFSLPPRLKERRGEGKWILREVLHRYVPPALVERPKRGFHMPIDEWLRGPLRSWARDMLSPALLARQGYLDPTVIRSQLEEHLAGTHVRGANLWVALMFQAWLAEQAERPQRELRTARA